MSLINEALKKARQEAAQQEAVRRGLPAAKAPAFAPRRDLRRIGRAAALVVLLLLAAAGGAWLARGGRGDGGQGGGDRADAPATAVQAPATEAAIAGGEPAATAEAARDRAPLAASPRERPPPPVGGAAPAPADVVPTHTPAAGAQPAAAPSPASEAPPSPVADPATEPPATGSPASPAAPASAAAPAAQPPPPAAEPEADPRQATLPDGSVLRLDGIAWSETFPTAVLNGQLVGRGERVSGALVRRIERDRVVIELAGRELVLHLR